MLIRPVTATGCPTSTKGRSRSAIQVRGKTRRSICPVASVSVRVAHSLPDLLVRRRAWVMVPTSWTSPSVRPEVRRAAMVGRVGAGVVQGA